MRYAMTGYGAIVIGISIIMMSIIAASMGTPLAVMRSKALMSFGGFMVALGFVTSGCFSKDSDEVRAGMSIAGAIVIVGTMMLI